MGKQVVVAIAIALTCAACGGSSDPVPPAATSSAGQTGAQNSEPVIESAVLSPDPAGAADSLSVEVRAQDPDRDRLRTTIEWFRNNQPEHELTGDVLDSGTFNRGDRVYAVAHVTDGTHEVSRATNAVAIGNSAPRIRSIAISPAHGSAADVIEATANAQDIDGDSFELSYRWYKNGAPIDGATESRLRAGTAHRGDKLVVEISASDGSDASDWFRSTEYTLGNSDPVITSQPSYEMGPTGMYNYEVAAKDADGDQPLRYELLSGPKGMAIDGATGVVTWAVPQDAKASNPIEVAVSDGFGGRVTQHWVLSVDWNQMAPAAQGNAAKKGAKPAAPAAPSDSDESAAPAKPAKDTKAQTPQRAQPQRGEGDDLERDQGEEYRNEKQDEF
jgi:hypothetical protein